MCGKILKCQFRIEDFTKMLPLKFSMKILMTAHFSQNVNLKTENGFGIMNVTGFMPCGLKNKTMDTKIEGL